jgi:hypothetical protein
MLLYNKALDPIHTTLRIAAICLESKSGPVEIDRIQILSFLLAFPSHIADMKLSKEALNEKRAFKKYRSPYNNYDAYSLFSRMTPTFSSSLAICERIGFLAFSEGDLVEVYPQRIPEQIKKIILSAESSIPKDAIIFERKHLYQMPMLGRSGLKAASNLMDYKYDYV